MVLEQDKSKSTGNKKIMTAQGSLIIDEYKMMTIDDPVNSVFRLEIDKFEYYKHKKGSHS